MGEVEMKTAEDAIRAIVAELVWGPHPTSYEEAKKRERLALQHLNYILASGVPLQSVAEEATASTIW